MFKIYTELMQFKSKNKKQNQVETGEKTLINFFFQRRHINCQKVTLTYESMLKVTNHQCHANQNHNQIPVQHLLEW